MYIPTSCTKEHYKRLQNFDRMTSYLYGTSNEKVCKTELLKYININD